MGAPAGRSPSTPLPGPCAPSVLVVDASVVAVALADDSPDGDRTRARLRGETLAAPDLLDLEVTSVLRGRLAGGHLDARRAELALRDLLDLPLQRVPARHLVGRCWELRNNLTVYDAAYVALAEALAATLLTADAKLSRAPGLSCTIEVQT
jgi:predicted nucleic acid-binding protein